MIKPRQEILSINPTFAAHLITVQQAKYQPKNEWTAGDSVILDDSNGTVELSKEQADNLNKEDQEYYLTNRDNFEIQNLNKSFGSIAITSPKKNSTEYLNDLGLSLTELSKEFGELIILGRWNTPWLNQTNDYLPAAEATKFLSQKIDKDFNGGFVLKTNEIAEFIPHLFWLTRCNASLPKFIMAFKNSKTILGICKFGIFHLEFYDDEEQKEIMSFFNGKKFIEVNRCSDPIDFDDFKGRQIIIK